MQTPRYHVIFDIEAAGPAIRDAKKLTRFIREAVAAVNMNIIAGPTVAKGVPENPGLSGFAILDFSHISVHTFTENDEVLIDIFSCKPFDIAVARSHCMKTFGTKKSKVREKTVWWGTDETV